MIKEKIKQSIKKLANFFGYDISYFVPKDFEDEDIKIINSVRNYTMTGTERIYVLIQAVNYIINNNIPGSIVECGVWKGGSMMAVAKALINLNNSERHLYLFDTFEGMTEPSNIDINFKGFKASKTFQKLRINDNSSDWCYASLEEVKQNMYSTKYDKEKIHFIKGKVEKTIPDKSPKVISLLRLDTDFYESTKHELKYLFPLLSRGGIIIIDDYGHWLGQKRAVDEYIEKNNLCLFLNRIDYTGRIGVKI